MTEFEDFLGTEHRDKEDLKSETEIGMKKADIILLKKRTANARSRHIIVNQKDADLTSSWILGHPSSSCNSLGNGGSVLGYGTTSEYYKIRVVNPNRTYVDNLHSDRFKDTTSTAVWNTTTGEVIF